MPLSSTVTFSVVVDWADARVMIAKRNRRSEVIFFMGGAKGYLWMRIDLGNTFSSLF